MGVFVPCAVFIDEGRTFITYRIIAHEMYLQPVLTSVWELGRCYKYQFSNSTLKPKVQFYRFCTRERRMGKRRYN